MKKTGEKVVPAWQRFYPGSASDKPAETSQFLLGSSVLDAARQNQPVSSSKLRDMTERLIAIRSAVPLRPFFLRIGALQRGISFFLGVGGLKLVVRKLVSR